MKTLSVNSIELETLAGVNDMSVGEEFEVGIGTVRRQTTTLFLFTALGTANAARIEYVRDSRGFSVFCKTQDGLTVNYFSRRLRTILRNIHLAANSKYDELPRE